jgi:hypothetical protein
VRNLEIVGGVVGGRRLSLTFHSAELALPRPLRHCNDRRARTQDWLSAEIRIVRLSQNAPKGAYEMRRSSHDPMEESSHAEVAPKNQAFSKSRPVAG